MAGIRTMFAKYPVTRGMVVYAVLWPSSDFCRQLAVIRTEKKDSSTPIDYSRMLRFSLFGSLWVAPTVFTWVKLTGKLITGSTLGVAAFKALIEQFTYGPFSIIAFYFGMSLLEGNTVDDASKEVKNKFFPTWRMGITFWPLVQTFNFSVIPERNRVIVVGIASFIWTAYLSFMKAREIQQ